MKCLVFSEMLSERKVILPSYLPITNMRFKINFFHLWATKPSTSCFTMYSTGTVGHPHTKLYIMHEDVYEYILSDSQADMMKHEVDTGQIVTKIIFL